MEWQIFSDGSRHGPARNLNPEQQQQVFRAITDPNHPNQEDYKNIALRAGMIESNSIVAEGEWIDSNHFATNGSADFWRDIHGE